MTPTATSASCVLTKVLVKLLIKILVKIMAKTLVIKILFKIPVKIPVFLMTSTSILMTSTGIFDRSEYLSKYLSKYLSNYCSSTCPCFGASAKFTSAMTTPVPFIGDRRISLTSFSPVFDHIRDISLHHGTRGTERAHPHHLDHYLTSF